MPLYRWATFQDLLALQDRMNRILEEAIGRTGMSDVPSPGEWQPSCDMFETDDAFLVMMEIPGVNRDDFEVSVTGNQLIVSGCRRLPTDASKEAFLRMERTYGKFQREVTLPAGVDAEQTSAELEDGVVQIRVPRQQARVEVETE